MASDDSARIYRFSITVTVGPDQPGYEDPEWFADAAWGALTNIYGCECIYGEITELP